MKKQSLFIDTDMGVDDIIAIGLLVLSNKYNLVGISVVNGVASSNIGARNACRLCQALNIKIPIYKGITQVDQNSNIQFPKIDRTRAMNLTMISNKLPPYNGQSIYDLKSLSSSDIASLLPEKSTVLCLGPLSNISLLTRNAEFTKRTKQIVIMGGAIISPGNVKPYYLSEYNIRLDIISAQSVFKKNISKLVIPVDATNYVPATKNSGDSIQSIKTFKLFIAWLSNYSPSTVAANIIKYIIMNNKSDFNYFHDPLAAIVSINKSVITKQDIGTIRISYSSRNIGKTSFSKNISGSSNVVFSVSSKRFFKTFKKLLEYGGD